MNTVNTGNTGSAVAPALLTAADVQHVLDHKTKPLGALGRLEDLANQIARLQQTLTPRLTRPHAVVFAADHGIAAEGVSAYPPEVTHQMVRNFAAGGAAINVFCRLHGLELVVVDAGVRGSFADLGGRVRDEKIAEGTASFLTQPAMTLADCADALLRGCNLVRELAAAGCNVVAFGEMGIGNTSSAALLLHLLTGAPLADCIGRGTGLDDAGLAHKRAVLTRALAAHPRIDTSTDPLFLLVTFGGFEIVQLVGALLEAAQQGMLVLVDGFIVGAALLVAVQENPDLLAHCVLTHRSAESGHRLLVAELERLGAAPPLLDLGLRLGEGTGAVLAYPLVQAAVAMLTEMASFESAEVSGRAGG